MKTDNAAYAANTMPSASSVPASAAAFGFTPKAKSSPNSKRETSDMDVSGTIVLQNEGKAGESPRMTRKGSISLATKVAFEPSMAKSLIEPENSVDLHESVEGEDLAQETNVGKERGKERQMAERLNDSEEMQIDNDQMQGESHYIMKESPDVDRR